MCRDIKDMPHIVLMTLYLQVNILCFEPEYFIMIIMLCYCLYYQFVYLYIDGFSFLNGMKSLHLKSKSEPVPKKHKK